MNFMCKIKPKCRASIYVALITHSISLEYNYNVATNMNYGLASFSSWSKSTCHPQTSNTSSTEILKTTTYF